VRVYQFRHIRVGSSLGPASQCSRAIDRPRWVGTARAGTITRVSTDRIHALLETAFPDASEVQVIDRGGGDHLEVRVTTPAFDGLTRIAQHKLIYAALAEPWSEGIIHELRINTKGTT
jgi:stress-induced morphogen